MVKLAEKMPQKVQVYIYDLSMGLASQFSALFLGEDLIKTNCAYFNVFREANQRNMVLCF